MGLWSSGAIARYGALLAVAVALSACAGGMDLDRLAADGSLVTGSVEREPDKVASAQASDEAAIRAAVAAWAPGETPPAAVPWVNANTGSTGAITIGRGSGGNGESCRDFTASREAFDGVGLLNGRACSLRNGPWQVILLSAT